MANKGIRWDVIEHDYVTGGLSLRKLAEKHGVGMREMSHRSKAGEWVVKREAFRKAATERAIEKSVDLEADRLMGIAHIQERVKQVMELLVQDEKQFNRHLVQTTVMDDDGIRFTSTEEKEFKKYDTKAIRDIQAALKDMVTVTTRVYDLETRAEKEAQRIAAARLLLEQKRAEREESKGDKQVVEVVFADDVEEVVE